ncbi:hypothetical protein PSE10B_14160 [Pseudomonas amygdali pv. eriobotryae]|uniref:hypothetical protein n=1 Tax=Pseudomonas amygdali TaxID=47877 RepID=UPI00167C4256|nr:hypothetical protein [Pseudomonas amygdali]GFZ64894.1 hypothetical protein PSE10B_14160 [Pseudomonas amygdali pv. eriobotryae]
MMFSAGEINELSEHRLVIECFKITVFRHTSEKGVSFSGPGQIYFDDSKSLRVKIFDADKPLDNWALLGIAVALGQKKEVTESDLYEIHATDSSGNQWVAENVYILPFVRSSAQGTVIDAPINSIKSIRDQQQDTGLNFFDIMIPGKFKIPFNGYTTYIENQVKLDKLEFSRGDLRATIRCSNNHMGIELERAGGENQYGFMVSFLEAMAIATGIETFPAYYRLATSSSLTSFISSGSSYNESSKHAVAPIVELRPGTHDTFIDFLTCYIKERTFQHNNMIHYWRRLYHVPKPINEVAALVLSVNIEGMLKDYFTPTEQKPLETTLLIEESRLKLKTANFDDRISSRLNSLIGNYGKPSARQSLKILVSEGKILEEHMQSWTRLRNALAHADSSQNDELSRRKMRRDIQVCFDLFCKLICLCICYSGPVIDHISTHDDDSDY